MSAVGFMNGLWAALLMHYLPLSGEVTSYGYEAFQTVPSGRSSWWPSVVVLPLALAAFSAMVTAVSWPAQRPASER